MMSKRGAMLVCDIAVVRSVDGMTPILMYFMPLGSMILSLFPFLLTMIIVNFQGRLLVLQLALDPMRELDWELKPNAVWLFLE